MGERIRRIDTRRLLFYLCAANAGKEIFGFRKKGEKGLSHSVSKAAFVAIVGKPNVGKSSILNELLGEKIAIVTSKPQTTRTRIMGVLTRDNTQFVFLDTPGFHKAKTKLSDNMRRVVTSSIKDVDIVVLVVEPEGRLIEPELQLLENIKASGLPCILVINKIDLYTDKAVVVRRITELCALHTFDAVVPVSVLKKEGLDALLDELDGLSEEGEHYFPDDTLTDQPERVIAAEIIREKLLLNLQQEIPHGTAVLIERMREREDQNIIDIEATIYCEKASHKGMIIGKGGQCLKRIATAARADLETFLDMHVNLKCWVKVQEGWRNQDSAIRNFGLSDDQ